MNYSREEFLVDLGLLGQGALGAAIAYVLLQTIIFFAVACGIPLT